MTGVPDAVHQDGSYPRPQLMRAGWADLSGEWDFAVSDAVRPEDVTFDRVIRVPFPPESPASGIGETGFLNSVWYRRRFGAAELAASGRDEAHPRIALRFGAVDWIAEVWLDGRYLGRHEGGQTPFSFDLPMAAQAEHEVVVRAIDDPHDVSVLRGKQDWRKDPHSIWYHRTTGIWQTVWLEALPSVSIERVDFTSDLSRAAVTAHVEIDAAVSADMWVSVVIRHDGEVLAEARVRALDRSVEVPLVLAVQRNGQRYEELLWRPDSPVLLGAEIALVDGRGNVVDAVGSYLGMRSVRAEASRFLLNDRPVPVRAVLAQNYWPESHLAAPSTSALRREVELILELGFNAARVHQKAEDPRFLFWADRLGLMVWAETASAYAFDPRSIAHLTREWTDLVVRDRSHPCIVAWVPLNESWGIQHLAHDDRQRAFSVAMAQLTRALDDSRPVISNDGWEHTDSDIWTIHDYDGDPESLARRYGDSGAVRAQFSEFGPAGRRLTVGDTDRGQPIVLSEFGGVSLHADSATGGWGYSDASDPADFEARVVALIEAAERAPLAGFCYTQLTDTGQETNGLLDAQRRPKVNPARIRAAVRGEAH